MAPLQPLVHEDLADAAALHADALVLVEVGAQTVQRPAAEGQAQALRIGQRRGDHLGALLGGVGMRASGPGPILQAVEAPLIEAMDPGVDGGARQTQLLGDLAGPPSVGDGQEDLGALHESGLCGPRVGQLLEGVSFLGSQLAERNFGKDHGCTSLTTKATSFLRQTAGVSSLAGCTTKRVTN
jgi:hypothetical protein